MAKRRAESAREGEDQPFGGAAADAACDQLRHTAVASSAPPPMLNQMLDLLEGYLDSIAATATQAVANGGPLAEFSASLEVSVDTVAAQAKEI